MLHISTKVQLDDVKLRACPLVESATVAVKRNSC